MKTFYCILLFNKQKKCKESPGSAVRGKAAKHAVPYKNFEKVTGRWFILILRSC